VTNLAVLTEGTSDVRLSGLTNNVFLPQTPESFTYDADGNLTADGRWIYTWDAENRLVCMTNKSGVPSGAQMQLNFTYDSKGRRINKTVIASGVTNTLKFVYDGWNLLASLTNSSTLNEVFTWGLDLSGSMQGAGGVGGLLIVNQPTAQTAFVAYDGNGNVSALVNAANSSVLAQYEYGPFGEVIRASGPMAKLNPFRFSTKYQDDETDLLYYGCRYYNASNGRWLIRDPLEEQGFDCLQNVDTFGDSSGPNLYNFVANEPLSDIDLFGLKLGDVTGEHALPPYNPSQIGKKCCGMSHCPAHITGTRTDQPPTVYKGSVIIYTSWQLHLSVHINPDSDCYTDVRVDWTRCWGTGGAGYMGSGTEISIPVSTWNHIGGSVTYLTTARINYLTCENGVWAKKLTIAGLSYTWNGSGWEFFTSDNGQISLGE
jgi:RHS repeat-associated protein